MDHPASAAGGRELWGIPKQHAAFRVRGHGADGAGFAASAVTPDGRPITTLRFRGRAALPGRWRLRTRTAQRSLDHDRGKALKIAAAEVLVSVGFGAAAWDFAFDGPLGFLHGREPFLGARLTELSLRFGS